MKDEECAECAFGEDCSLGEIVDAAENRINELAAENAALRERLEKAVEHGKYFIIEEPRNGKIYYSILRHKVVNNYICTELTREAAEARLAELKGEEKDG